LHRGSPPNNAARFVQKRCWTDSANAFMAKTPSSRRFCYTCALK